MVKARGNQAARNALQTSDLRREVGFQRGMDLHEMARDDRSPEISQVGIINDNFQL